LPTRRKDTAKELLDRADVAANRIEQGIALLGDPQCLEAFRIANRAMAVAAKRRQGIMSGKNPAAIVPKWRPFQLAFILMNLPGISDPTHADRNVVDLLFFPHRRQDRGIWRLAVHARLAAAPRPRLRLLV
jgi:hypothetical protein